MPKNTVSAEAYRRAKTFLYVLGESRTRLDRQQLLTLKGQALEGDIDGAYHGLWTILHDKALQTTITEVEK